MEHLKTIQLLKLRLVSHRLLSAQPQTPEAVVAWMDAMQTQDFNMAKRPVGIRLANAALDHRPCGKIVVFRRRTPAFNYRPLRVFWSHEQA
jgi:hypothetical protein